MMAVAYTVMMAYFAGMLLHLLCCKLNAHTDTVDALSSLWWPFAIWDRLPPLSDFHGDGTDPRNL